MAGKTDERRGAKEAVAGLLALFLIIISGVVLWQFVDAFFIAVIGYIFLHPVYRFFRAKGFDRSPSAFATVLFGAVVIGIPLLIVLNLLVSEATNLFNQAAVNQEVSALGARFAAIGTLFPQIGSSMKLNTDFTGAALDVVNFLRSIVFGWMGSIGTLALDLVVALFTFYYLLVSEEKLGKMRNYIPFSGRNTDRLVAEGRAVLYSSVLVTGLMAVVQSILITIVFMYFGVPAAIFLGMISAVLACVPFTGLPFVWGPVAIVEAASGNWAAAIGIVIAGIVIAIIDNVRPVMQNKIGSIHPMVSLLGVLVGIAYFGILGLLIGPVVLALALLSARMFKEEYL